MASRASHGCRVQDLPRRRAVRSYRWKSSTALAVVAGPRSFVHVVRFPVGGPPVQGAPPAQRLLAPCDHPCRRSANQRESQRQAHVSYLPGHAKRSVKRMTGRQAKPILGGPARTSLGRSVRVAARNPRHWKQSTPDRGPRHGLAQQCLDGCMDVLGPHRLVVISQHFDDSLQHPAWSARPLPTGHSPPPRPAVARTAASFPARRPNDPCRSWFGRGGLRWPRARFPTAAGSSQAADEARHWLARRPASQPDGQATSVGRGSNSAQAGPPFDLCVTGTSKRPSHSLLREILSHSLSN